MQQNPDLAKLMQLAQSPAGQKLIAMLQQNGGTTLQNAMEKASAGDYEDAKRSISALLNNQEAKALLQQLGGSEVNERN